MGNNISLEENENEYENEDQGIQSRSSETEMKVLFPKYK